MNRLPTAIASHHVPWLRLAVTGAVVLALAALAPLVWLAVAGGAGLLVLGGLAAAGLAAIQLLPWLGQRLENTVLAMRKAEAQRSPVEQLQNELLRRAARLASFRTALATVGGQIESIGQTVAELRQRDPGHDLQRQERAHQRLQQFHSVNLLRLAQAHAALEEFGNTVRQKESEWRLAVEIGQANRLMDPQATNNLMEGFLADEALRTVQDRFNTVFAELDVQMSSLDSPTRQLLDDRNRDRMDALQVPARALRGLLS